MRRRAGPAAFLVFFAFTAGLQALHGAYSSDFGGNADEAAHYVSGVMVRDYLAAVPWTAPMPFARDFYNHYPMVAIGHWPPMFYVAQSIWTLPFGVSRPSVLLLIALFSAATATVMFVFWQRRFGTIAAAALALTFLSVPIVQQYGRMVMAEMLVTLLMMLAATAYARYLETERWRDSLAFALLASVAILTKPNALALAFVPAFAVIVVRRADLLWRLSYWIPAVIVALICAPWYVFAADMMREGWSASYDASWLLREPATENALQLVYIATTPVFGAALIGLIHELWPRQARVSTHSAVMAALLFSIWLFHSFVVPVREARHLIPAVPALLGFCAAAIVALTRFIAPGSAGTTWGVPVLGAVMMTTFLLGGSGAPQPVTGADRAVETVLSHTTSDSVLVSSEGFGEGVFIAELVQAERRPGHRVLRASKVLSSSTWNGSEYRLLYGNAADADAYLRTADINVIVLDLRSAPSRRPVPHHRQLLDVVQRSGRWRRLTPGPDAGFAVFQAVSP